MKLLDKIHSNGLTRVLETKSSLLTEDASPHKSSFNLTTYISLDKWSIDLLSISFYSYKIFNHQNWILLSGQILRPNGVQGRELNIKPVFTNNWVGTCLISEVPTSLCSRQVKSIQNHFRILAQENYWITNLNQETLKYQAITYADYSHLFNPLSGNLSSRLSQAIFKVTQLMI